MYQRASFPPRLDLSRPKIYLTMTITITTDLSTKPLSFASEFLDIDFTECLKRIP